MQFEQIIKNRQTKNINILYAFPENDNVDREDVIRLALQPILAPGWHVLFIKTEAKWILGMGTKIYNGSHFQSRNHMSDGGTSTNMHNHDNVKEWNGFKEWKCKNHCNWVKITLKTSENHSKARLKPLGQKKSLQKANALFGGGAGRLKRDNWKQISCLFVSLFKSEIRSFYVIFTHLRKIFIQSFWEWFPLGQSDFTLLTLLKSNHFTLLY